MLVHLPTHLTLAHTHLISDREA